MLRRVYYFIKKRHIRSAGGRKSMIGNKRSVGSPSSVFIRTYGAEGQGTVYTADESLRACTLQLVGELDNFTGDAKIVIVEQVIANVP
jgi:hypothetical protein